MLSDNKIDQLGFRSFFAKPFFYYAVGILTFFFSYIVVNFIYNLVMSVIRFIGRGNFRIEKSSLSYFEGLFSFKAFFFAGGFILFIIAVALCGFLAFKAAHDYKFFFDPFSLLSKDAFRNRWTTRDEIKKQYKAVPLTKENYRGESGHIVSRIGSSLYIDTDPVNMMYQGSTRSGKGEGFIFPQIDVHSRAEIKPSLVIADPKEENFKSSKKTLQKRGYNVWLFNLIDTVKGMGYNPFHLSVKYYKEKRYSESKELARSFAFQIFHADEKTSQEPIWKNTATDLFTALIVANIDDLIRKDEEANFIYEQRFKRKQKLYDELSEDEKKNADIRWDALYAEHKDEFINKAYENAAYIPSSIEFKRSCMYEKAITPFSVINFFQELCNIALSEEEISDIDLQNQKIETALDAYFMQREQYDYAKSLYLSIKSAGDRTKGSVYTNMQSALTIFALDNIRRLTSKNEIDIEQLGYGDKPIALFLCVPFEEKSNYFLACTLIAQINIYLAKLARKSKGKLHRKVYFILDEFINFPVIENFSRYVSVGLGLGIYYTIFLQSIAQLSSKYKDDFDEILDNFGNQLYLLGAKESPKYFSELLGKRYGIKLEKTGALWSREKSVMEQIEESPLISEEKLKSLREGESVLNRVTKRKNLEGKAIFSYPIINEYNEVFNYAKDSFKDRLKRKFELYKMGQDEKLEAIIQKAKDIGSIDIEQKAYGTAALFRYEYLQDDFPNATELDFNDLCEWDLSHIDLDDYMRDINEVVVDILKLDDEIESMPNLKIKDHRFYNSLNYLLKSELGERYREIFRYSEDDSLINMLHKVRNSSDLSDNLKKIIENEILAA